MWPYFSCRKSIIEQIKNARVIIVFKLPRFQEQGENDFQFKYISLLAGFL